MNLPFIRTRRRANLVGFLICGGLMGYALFAQHALNLAPCPLCILQRVAVIAMGIIFLAAAVHSPASTGARMYSLLLIVAAAAGAGVAGRHVWLQSLPLDQVPACGPGLGYMLEFFPLFDALDMIFAGSGECAKIDWVFLGLSMPAWVLIVLSILAAFGVISNWRLSR